MPVLFSCLLLKNWLFFELHVGLPFRIYVPYSVHSGFSTYSHMIFVSAALIFFLDSLYHFLVRQFLLLWFADDPDVPEVQHYRNFLKEHVVFKEVRYT